MKLTLTFATNYNGVFINPTDHENTEITTAMYKVFDEVSDTLPEFTYKWSDKFDTDLSDKHINKLIKKAMKIVRPVFPDITKEDIEFEYDDTST